MKNYITYTKYNDLIVFWLEVERLDFFDTSDILKHIQTIIEQYNYPHVLVDFSKTKTISSSGLGLLISLKQKLEQKNRELGLININSVITMIFKLMGIEKYFKVFSSLEDALILFYREAERMIFLDHSLVMA